jgi:hypothetical protein
MNATPVIDHLEPRCLLSATLAWGFKLGFREVLDSANAVATDGGGNTYVAGVFRGRVDFDPSPNRARFLRSVGSEDDIFVAKYNASRKLLWARRFGGKGIDTADALAFGAGTLALAGSFDRAARFGAGASAVDLTSHGGMDGYVARLNPANGAVVWAGAVGGKIDDAATAVAVGTGGEVYLAGSIRLGGDVDPGPGTTSIKTRGVDDSFIACLSPANGRLLWHKIFGENATRETVMRLAADPAGGVIAAGMFNESVQFDRSSSRFTIESHGGYDIFILKLSAAGHFTAARHFGGRDTETFGGMAVGPTGDLYFTGTFQSSANFSAKPGAPAVRKTGSDPTAFICRQRADGALVWVRQFGDDAAVIPTAIGVDAAGMVWAAGTFDDDTDFDPGKARNILKVDKDNARLLPGQRRPTDAFLVRYDAQGKFQDVSRIGGPDGSVILRDLAVDAAGELHVVGQFANRINIDPRGRRILATGDDNQDSDALVLRLR